MIEFFRHQVHNLTLILGLIVTLTLVVHIDERRFSLFHPILTLYILDIHVYHENANLDVYLMLDMICH